MTENDIVIPVWLPRSPRFELFRDVLKVGVPQALGHLTLLLAWASEFLTDDEDGEVPILPQAYCVVAARAAGWTGEASMLIKALEAGAFLQSTDEGSYRVLALEWMVHHGQN